MDGIEATRHIVRTGGRSRILILTTFDLDEYAYRALRAGANGFLLKDARPDELLADIRAVAAGDAVVAPTMTRRLLDTFPRTPQRRRRFMPTRARRLSRQGGPGALAGAGH